LNLHRRRLRRFERLLGELTAVAHLRPVKGLCIARLYPPGIARHTNDLDCLAASQADVWTAARTLLERGWEIAGATFLRIGEAIEVVVELEDPNEENRVLRRPDSVELSSAGIVGDLRGIKPTGSSSFMDLPDIPLNL